MSASGKRNPYKVVDGSLPISTLLYDGEELLASQDGVGLYDGWVGTSTSPSAHRSQLNHLLVLIVSRFDALARKRLLDGRMGLYI